VDEGHLHPSLCHLTRLGDVRGSWRRRCRAAVLQTQQNSPQKKHGNSESHRTGDLGSTPRHTWHTGDRCNRHPERYGSADDDPPASRRPAAVRRFEKQVVQKPCTERPSPSTAHRRWAGAARPQEQLLVARPQAQARVPRPQAHPLVRPWVAQHVAELLRQPEALPARLHHRSTTRPALAFGTAAPCRSPPHRHEPPDH
jgi:hypothetical protein